VLLQDTGPYNLAPAMRPTGGIGQCEGKATKYRSVFQAMLGLESVPRPAGHSGINGLSGITKCNPFWAPAGQMIMPMIMVAWGARSTHWRSYATWLAQQNPRNAAVFQNALHLPQHGSAGNMSGFQPAHEGPNDHSCMPFAQFSIPSGVVLYAEDSRDHSSMPAQVVAAIPTPTLCSNLSL